MWPHSMKLEFAKILINNWIRPKIPPKYRNPYISFKYDVTSRFENLQMPYGAILRKTHSKDMDVEETEICIKFEAYHFEIETKLLKLT